LAFHAVGALEVAVARGGREPELTMREAAAPAGGPLERLSLHASLAGLDERRVDVHGLSLGVVAARVSRVHGLQAAFGLVQTDEEMVGVQYALGAAVARGRMRGLQLGGFANLADGQLRGAQLGGLVNVARGEARGLQLSGILNYATGTFRGARIGTINLSEDTSGAQIAAVNISKSAHGAQIAAVNTAGDSTGVQIGAVNFTGTSTGLELGAVNVAGQMNGFQLGAINVAGRARGFNLGVINIVGEHEGEALGVITIAGNGIHNVALYTSDTMPVNLAVKLGTRHLYTSFAVGYHAGPEADITNSTQITRDRRYFGAGLGIGWRFFMDRGRFESLELEASGMNVVSRFSDADNSPLLSALRLQGTFRLAPKLALFGGPSINVAVADDNRNLDVGLGVLERVERSGGTVVRIYPGFVFGAQL
jgi:hypothetical protein